MPYQLTINYREQNDKYYSQTCRENQSIQEEPENENSTAVGTEEWNCLIAAYRSLKFEKHLLSVDFMAYKLIGGKIFLDLLAVIYYTVCVGKERREVCRRSIEGDRRRIIPRLCV